MQQLFKGEEKLHKHQLVNDVYKNIYKQQFILKFFKNLPLEDLERLINFKEVDIENENITKFTCELYLDNGVDDLMLGQIG